MPAMIHRSARLMAVALLTALSATACSGSGSTPGDAKAAGPPRSGGTLKVALGAGVTCVDPQQTVSFDARAIGRGIADSLIEQDPRTGKLVPWLASSWHVSQDAKRFTFHLKPGVNFSDGTPLTPQTVADNLDYVKNTLGGKSARGAGYLAAYTGSKVVGNDTVEVDFGKPAAQFLIAASTPTLAILSPSTMKKSPAQRCEGALTGTGPFLLSSFRPNESALLTRRPGYTSWSGLAAHHGDAYLKEIDFKVIPVSSVQAGALSSGQVDVATGLAPQDQANVIKRGNTMLAKIQPGVPIHDFLNITRAPLNDPAVRHAMQLGIDRAAIVQSVLGPQFKAASSSLTSGTVGYTDLGQDVRYDPNAANTLLDQAGWRKGTDGLRSKNGVVLKVNVVFTTDFGAYFPSVAQLEQQEWKNLGIASDLQNITASTLLSDIASGSYDVILTSFTDSDPDILSSFLTAYFTDKQALQSSGVTAAMAAERSETDTAKRTAIMGKIQLDTIGNNFLIPIADAPQTAGASPQVHGLQYSYQASLQFFDTWTG